MKLNKFAMLKLMTLSKCCRDNSGRSFRYIIARIKLALAQ